MIFYIGDLNLFSSSSAEENAEQCKQLISNWNERVSATDDVYILGKLCPTYTPDIWDVLRQLNGSKNFLYTLEDSDLVSSWYTFDLETRSKYFAEVQQSLMIVDDDILVYAATAPHADWPYSKDGAVHVYSWFSQDNFGYSSQFMLSLIGALNANNSVCRGVPKTLKELDELALARRRFAFSPVTGFFQ